ncbi:MAG: hypothetical protein V4532_03855, partial [Pseudomonadota bacterium]
MKYRDFALGCVVSALTASGAWATWAVFKPGSPAEEVIKGNGRLEVQRVEIAAKFPGRVLAVPV